jgi:uncharacterized protein YdaU (DUF1376 family)
MHYYQHHIGDFIKATSRLTDTQTMTYLRMLWMYYDSEKPIKNDLRTLAFQLAVSENDVDLILSSFFKLDGDQWLHSRCDQEISEYRSFIEKKSRGGKASAQQRLNSSSTGDEQVLNSCSTDVQLTNNHKPITNIVGTRGTRLSQDWELSEDQKQFCKQERPDLDPVKVSAGFKDYWISVAGAKGVKKDWDATWRNWVRNQRFQKSAMPENNIPEWKLRIK